MCGDMSSIVFKSISLTESIFFFQAEDGIRDLVRSRGLGDVYKRQLPDGLNQPARLLADTGFYSERNVQHCHDAGVEPLIAVGRDAHHLDWRSRFEEPAPLETPTSHVCLLYTSPSPRDRTRSRMPSSA